MLKPLKLINLLKVRIVKILLKSAQHVKICALLFANTHLFWISQNTIQIRLTTVTKQDDCHIF